MSRRVAQRAAIVIVLLAGAMGTAGCDPTALTLAGTVQSAPAVPVVALYGDSLTTMAWPDYQRITVGRVITDGHFSPGTELAYWRAAILHDPADRLVIALGTNDSLHDGAAPWATLLDQLPASKCIVWPKPYEGSDLVRTFNTDMATIVAAHPNVHVIDWNAMVEPHPDWVIFDHTHYLPAGSRAYATTLEQAALTCP